MGFLKLLASKYGFFVIGGAIGAVIHRLRNKMSFGRFLASIIISMFVALCTGIIARDYFSFPDDTVYVICGISGVFSEVILDEMKELITQISDIIKMKFGTDKNE